MPTSPQPTIINDRRVAADDSRDRLIRVEENLKHIDATLRDIKNSITEHSIKSIEAYKTVDKRVDELERRVDKIYWVWGAIVFVVPIVVSLATKFVAALFT